MFEKPAQTRQLINRDIFVSCHRIPLFYFISNYQGLVQDRRNSIANALELRLSCNNPSIRYRCWSIFMIIINHVFRSQDRGFSILTLVHTIESYVRHQWIIWRQCSNRWSEWYLPAGYDRNWPDAAGCFRIPKCQCWPRDVSGGGGEKRCRLPGYGVDMVSTYKEQRCQGRWLLWTFKWHPTVVLYQHPQP